MFCHIPNTPLYLQKNDVFLSLDVVGFTQPLFHSSTPSALVLVLSGRNVRQIPDRKSERNDLSPCAASEDHICKARIEKQASRLSQQCCQEWKRFYFAGYGLLCSRYNVLCFCFLSHSLSLSLSPTFYLDLSLFLVLYTHASSCPRLSCSHDYKLIVIPKSNLHI